MKVVKIIVPLLVAIIPIITFGQSFDLNLNAIMLRNNGVWKKNSEVNITKFVHETKALEEGMKNMQEELFYLVDNNGQKVNINSKVDDCFKFKYDNIQQMWDANIIMNVLYKLKKKGFQYDLRTEMENDF